MVGRLICLPDSWTPAPMFDCPYKTYKPTSVNKEASFFKNDRNKIINLKNGKFIWKKSEESWDLLFMAKKELKYIQIFEILSNNKKW